MWNRGTRPTLASVVAVVAAAAGTCLAGLETAGRDAGANLALAQKWQKEQPDRYARLIGDLKAFDALPEDRKDRLRKLDAELFRRPSAERARLWRVMERYALWRAALPVEDRQKLDALPPGRARAELVQSLRVAELLAQLPPDERDAAHKLAGPRGNLWQALADVRHEHALDWQVMNRNLGVVLTGDERLFSRVSTAPPVVKMYVTTFLRPLLSADEKARLDRAEGHWPRFPRILNELIEAHECRLPGDVPPAKRVTRWDDLTEDTKKKLGRMLTRAWLKPAEGQWPMYAVLVSEVARQEKVDLVQKFGPASADEFPLGVQHFIKKLGAEDAADLERYRGKWPEYPRTLYAIAKRRGFELPGKFAVVRLPDAFRGSRGLTSYRVPPAPVPDGPQPTDKTLRDFVLHDLSLEKRLSLLSTPDDRAGREEIRRLYFDQNPGEREAMTAADQQIKPGPKPR